MLVNFAEDSVREMSPVHSNVVESIIIKPTGFSKIEFVLKFYLCSRVGVPLYFACHIIPIPASIRIRSGILTYGMALCLQPDDSQKAKKRQNSKPLSDPNGIGIRENEL